MSILRTHLIPECVQELDRVCLDDRMDGTSRSLQIRKHMVRKEFHDVYKRICARDTLLNRRTSRCD